MAGRSQFATGWIQLAWAVVGAAGGNTVGALRAERFRGVREEIRPFLVRAYGLANGTPEWERCWILGSYYSLSLDPERAIPFYEDPLLLSAGSSLGRPATSPLRSWFSTGATSC